MNDERATAGSRNWIGAASILAAGLALAAPSIAYADDDGDDEYEVIEVHRRPHRRVIVEEEAPPPPARRPSTGVGLLVPGGIFTGLGILNLATSPICLTDLVDRDSQTPCLITSLVAGGVFLAVGIPLLAVGGARRAHYLEWRRRHPYAFDIAPVAGASGAPSEAPTGAIGRFGWSF